MKFLLTSNAMSSILTYTIDTNDEFPDEKSEAIDAAIEKWKTIAQAIKLTEQVIESGGRNTCPLCKLYFEDDCQDCPVMQKTGRWHCIKTPAMQYENVEEKGWEGWKRALKYAEREVTFLESLKSS